MTENLTGEERTARMRYVLTQAQVLATAEYAAGITALDEMLADIGRAETAAPFLDPTLYLRAGNALHAVREVTRAVRSLAEAWRKHGPAIPEAARFGMVLVPEPKEREARSGRE